MKNNDTVVLVYKRINLWLILKKITVLFVFKTYCYKYIMQKSVLFFLKASLKSVIFYSFYMCLLSFCFFFLRGEGARYIQAWFFYNQQRFKVKVMTHNISGILSCFTFEIYIYWVFSQDVFVCNAHSIHIHMYHQRNHNNSWAPVIVSVDLKGSISGESVRNNHFLTIFVFCVILTMVRNLALVLSFTTKI